MTSLAGRTALVTGASKGIGLAVSRALAGAGARVAMVSRSQKTLAQRADEMGAVAFAADVSSAPDVERLIAMLGARAMQPDILVNNAGHFTVAPLLDTPVTDFEAALRTNLAAPFLLTRALVPPLRAAGRGHVVTIGSIADRHAFPGNAAYAATKFGARAMHQVLRQELRGTGVRTSLVSPGPVDTSLWDAIDPDNTPGFTPRASMLDAAAVADAVLWVVTRPQNVNVDELRVSRS